MIEQRQLYGWADLVFYESLGEWSGHEDDRFAAVTREIPADWRRSSHDVWVTMNPDVADHPAQGWKIHVSSDAENAEHVVDTVWAYCTERGIPFKFLRDKQLFRLCNSKYMPRQSSGKLVTVYPRDDRQLETVLTELGAELKGTPGPYILSDLRWGEGPLHVRYGGFRRRYCRTGKGDRVLAVETPDGTLVPDERRPGHYAPPWVEIPEFLAPHLARRKAGTENFPYKVKRALHFSNGGGVYLAERLSDNRTVVLKEARPGAGLDMSGRDAVERLGRERWALERLAGVEGIPEFYEYLVAGGHHFLAMEYREGDVLWLWLATYHPLVHFGTDRADEREYEDKVTAISARLEKLIADVHERGVVFGDLHPGNILIRSDGQLSLVDFEAAFSTDGGKDERPALGAQGFVAPAGFTGTSVDRYALAMLRLWFHLPVNRLFPLSPTKLAETLTAVEARFADLPEGFCDRIRADTTPPPGADGDAQVSPFPRELVERRRAQLGRPLDVDLDADRVDWDSVRVSLASAIARSATPDRTDRLFPGDIQQFQHDALGFAHGAAGVLWALRTTGAVTTAPEHEKWLLDAVRTTTYLRPGFYSGLHGIAYVLDELGHVEEARETLERAREATRGLTDPSLFGGLAGAGLNLLHFAGRHDDEGCRTEAHELGLRLGRLLREPGSDVTPGRAQAGLMRGWSGVALFLLRLYESSGDETFWDLAVEALQRDLEACTTRSNGSVQVADSIRTLSYLEVGSGGIALVADELLTARADADLAAVLPALRRACQSEYVAEPHLFNGRSGLMSVVARLAHRDGGTEAREAVRRHLGALSWHKLSYEGHLAFPGDQSYRLSMDLATGNAGVLLGITAAVDGSTFLPFFTPRPQ
ncbi:class III lanthionine synthetase LanKC [Streptomyces sp. NBC_01353]|uniref:class III lanthionine synthetase LanKC n=1 Tax=Streptomyces sp. NBC_01353 TaxID=2903835 RepID=UPI002E31D9C8|nr:class III lanthionine synthetase LanKC [Streptomyces sp. NBC_01353]